MKRSTAASFCILVFALAIIACTSRSTVSRQSIQRTPPSQIVRPLEGTVQSIDTTSKTLTIRTSMGQTENVRFAEDTLISRQGARKTSADIHTAEGVRISYVNLPDRTLMAKEVMVGYSVSHCSCGNACACPLSRGCRAIRY